MSTTTQYEGVLTYVDESGNTSELYPSVKTDAGLSTSGKPADAKATGDAISLIEDIAEGKKNALVFDTYSDMVTSLNTLGSTELTRGDNIYIGSVDVPDLWVYSVESSAVTYTYTDDNTLVSELKTNVTVQIGYFKLATLESQTVDITSMQEDIDILASKVDALEQNKTSIVNSDLGVALGMAASDSWTAVVSDIEGVPVKECYGNNIAYDSEGNVFNRLGYGDFYEVTQLYTSDGVAQNSYIFNHKGIGSGCYIPEDVRIPILLYGLSPNNIKTGVKIGNPNTEGAYITGTFCSDATLASAANLLEGVTAYGKNGVKYTGTRAATPTLYTGSVTTSSSDKIGSYRAITLTPSVAPTLFFAYYSSSVWFLVTKDKYIYASTEKDYSTYVLSFSKTQIRLSTNTTSDHAWTYYYL